MNPENENILATIPKMVFLKAKILDAEGREISTGAINFLEDGSALYRPERQMTAYNQMQQAKTVALNQFQNHNLMFDSLA